MEVLHLLTKPVGDEKRDGVEPEFLIWKETGQKFAEYLAPVIKSGLLEMEGNESLLPLLARLTQYIKVRKVKGSGGVCQESLITYLKKAVSDE